MEVTLTKLHNPLLYFQLRNQAETELRALRAELTQKKINVTLARQQQQTALAPGLANTYTPGEMMTPRS